MRKPVTLALLAAAIFVAAPALAEEHEGSSYEVQDISNIQSKCYKLEDQFDGAAAGKLAMKKIDEAKRLRADGAKACLGYDETAVQGGYKELKSAVAMIGLTPVA